MEGTEATEESPTDILLKSMAEPPPIDPRCGGGEGSGTPPAATIGAWGGAGGSPTGWTAGAGMSTMLAPNWSWGCRGSQWWGKHRVWRRRREPHGDRGHYRRWKKVQLQGVWDGIHGMSQTHKVGRGVHDLHQPQEHLLLPPLVDTNSGDDAQVPPSSSSSVQLTHWCCFPICLPDHLHWHVSILVLSHLMGQQDGALSLHYGDRENLLMCWLPPTRWWSWSSPWLVPEPHAGKALLRAPVGDQKTGQLSLDQE